MDDIHNQFKLAMKNAFYVHYDNDINLIVDTLIKTRVCGPDVALDFVKVLYTK